MSMIINPTILQQKFQPLEEILATRRRPIAFYGPSRNGKQIWSKFWRARPGQN